MLSIGVHVLGCVPEKSEFISFDFLYYWNNLVLESIQLVASFIGANGVPNI